MKSPPFFFSAGLITFPNIISLITRLGRGAVLVRATFSSAWALSCHLVSDVSGKHSAEVNYECCVPEDMIECIDAISLRAPRKARCIASIASVDATLLSTC